MHSRLELRGRPAFRLVLLLAFAAVLAAGVLGAQQQPTFRASVELIAVDVQVVDHNGAPMTNLRPESFEVTIDGKRHKVGSVDFVRHSVSDRSSGVVHATSGPIATNEWPTGGPGRTFMIAVDLGSFDVGESRGVAAA